LKAAIHIRLAMAANWGDGVQRRLHHAELAVRAASRVSDIAVRCRALAAFGMAHFYAGQGIATAEMTEAMDLERSLSEWPLHNGPTYQSGAQLLWSANVERGREIFQELL